MISVIFDNHSIKSAFKTFRVVFYLILDHQYTIIYSCETLLQSFFLITVLNYQYFDFHKYWNEKMNLGLCPFNFLKTEKFVKPRLSSSVPLEDKKWFVWSFYTNSLNALMLTFSWLNPFITVSSYLIMNEHVVQSC